MSTTGNTNNTVLKLEFLTLLISAVTTKEPFHFYRKLFDLFGLCTFGEIYFTFIGILYYFDITCLFSVRFVCLFVYLVLTLHVFFCIYCIYLLEYFVGNLCIFVYTHCVFIFHLVHSHVENTYMTVPFHLEGNLRTKQIA